MLFILKSLTTSVCSVTGFNRIHPDPTLKPGYECSPLPREAQCFLPPAPRPVKTPSFYLWLVISFFCVETPKPLSSLLFLSSPSALESSHLQPACHPSLPELRVGGNYFLRQSWGELTRMKGCSGFLTMFSEMSAHCQPLWVMGSKGVHSKGAGRGYLSLVG